MLANKEGFILYKRQYGPISQLSDEDLGQLFRAIFDYQMNGTEPNLPSASKMAFQFIREQFEIDEAKYQKVVERNQANGKNGGRPKNNPKNPVGLLKPRKPDKDKENDFIKSQVSGGSEELSEEQITDAMNYALSLSNAERWQK